MYTNGDMSHILLVQMHIGNMKIIEMPIFKYYHSSLHYPSSFTLILKLYRNLRVVAVGFLPFCSKVSLGLSFVSSSF